MKASLALSGSMFPSAASNIACLAALYALTLFQRWPLVRHVFRCALGARNSYPLAGRSRFDGDGLSPQMQCHVIDPPFGERAACVNVPGRAA